MADIFISYAREDLDRVRPIVKFIEDNGWSVFWDRTIPPGLTWREYIGKALDEARCVIVVWSRNSVKSEFVQEEADDGRERKILIPIRIDDVRPPLGFRAIQHEDFAYWKGESDNWRAKGLIKAIEGFAGKPKKKAIVPPAKPNAEVQPFHKQKPASKTEEPREDSPPNTPLRPTSSSKKESLHRKRKISFFFKLGPMVASLTVAAVILAVGLNFWLKDQNRPTTSPTTETSSPAAIKKPSVKDKETVASQVERKKKNPTLDTELPKTFRNSIGMEFVLIPAGTFTMGSSPGVGFDDERPSHAVEISQTFYLQKTEITQGQWKKIMGDNPSEFINCGDGCPAENVSWNDVEKFIQKLNEIEDTDKYRLPTEAEWEYACRAGTTTVFSLANNAEKLEEYAWYNQNFGKQTHPVATRKPNLWGLYDMHGNVWEWVEDDWHVDYSGAPTDGRAWVDSPRGPYRVLRGGSWNFAAPYCRSAARNNLAPDRSSSFIGFRLARSVALGS